jgi:hypothetical protein
MTDSVTVAASVAILIHQELEDDYVGLWKLPWHIRRAYPAVADHQVQAIAAGILRALLARNVAIGNLDETTGDFDPWPLRDAVECAMAAWRDLGRDPNIGEVAWLASTS